MIVLAPLVVMGTAPSDTDRVNLDGGLRGGWGEGEGVGGMGLT